MELLIFYYVKVMARLKFGKEKAERKLKKNYLNFNRKILFIEICYWKAIRQIIV